MVEKYGYIQLMIKNINGMLNKSLIVNLSKIEGIIGENVILQDHRMLYVSRDYRK